MSKLGDRLKELSDKHGYGKPAPDAYSAIAEAFANEVRHDAIPWAHKALDDVGAPKGPDLARSTSTWIHWWSPVASANWLIRSWVTWTQSLTATSWPTSAASSARV